MQSKLAYSRYCGGLRPVLRSQLDDILFNENRRRDTHFANSFIDSLFDIFFCNTLYLFRGFRLGIQAPVGSQDPSEDQLQNDGELSTLVALPRPHTFVNTVKTQLKRPLWIIPATANAMPTPFSSD